MANNLPIAILIDGDNASPEKLNEAIRFATTYGNPIIKRIYADWTKPSSNRWKEVAFETSFRLIEAPSYVSKKNTTDIALVIDAMDILLAGTVKGFCIVSSDSDYTLLAQRIREAGLLILGYGESKAPLSFVNTCNKFQYSDKEVFPVENSPAFFLQRDAPLFDKVFQEASTDGETASTSVMGSLLRKHIPKYNIRRYQCKTLLILYERLGKYEIIQVQEGKSIKKMVRLKYDLFDLLDSINVYMVQVGVECGYPEGLKKVRKGISIEKIKDFAVRCQNREFRKNLYWSFIIGFPWESEKEIVKTINFAFDCAAYANSMFPQVNNFAPYPGTDITLKFNEYDGKQIADAYYNEQYWYTDFLGQTTIPDLKKEHIKQYLNYRFLHHPSFTADIEKMQ